MPNITGNESTTRVSDRPTSVARLIVSGSQLSGAVENVRSGMPSTSSILTRAFVWGKRLTAKRVRMPCSWSARKRSSIWSRSRRLTQKSTSSMTFSSTRRGMSSIVPTKGRHSPAASGRSLGGCETKPTILKPQKRWLRIESASTAALGLVPTISTVR
jgi:hypothetical protein